jgi:hypothetical protein
MNDRVHPVERLGPRGLPYSGRRKEPVDPNRAVRLREMADQATTERIRNLLREMAGRCDPGEERGGASEDLLAG